MLKEDEVFDSNYIRELDSLIMHEIVSDIINGMLLLQADSDTLDMRLPSIWEMRESYERAGVIIGDA